MKYIFLAILIVLNPGIAQACGIMGWDWLGTCKIASEAKDAVDKAMAQVRQTQEYIVRSTPGLHDVADLNDLASSDPKVRQAAADRYRNLLAAAEGLNQAQAKIPQWQLVASFDFDETKVFRIGITRAADGLESTARLYLEDNSIELWTDQARPKRVNANPPSETQVRQQLLAKADAVLDNLTGNQDIGQQAPIVTPYGAVSSQTLQYPNALTATRVVAGGRPIQPTIQQVNQQRAAIKENLVDMILSAYSYSENRLGSPNSTYDWSLTDGKTHVILYADDSTYLQQSDWKILVRVQLASDPSQSLYQRPTRELHKKDFRLLKLSDGRVAYWTPLEMTAAALPSDAVLAALEAQKKVMEAIINDKKSK
jgi:hypothetical protein